MKNKLNFICIITVTVFMLFGCSEPTNTKNEPCSSLSGEQDDNISEQTNKIENFFSDYNADRIQYFFSTVADLETYLNTGSTNLSDYSQPPQPFINSSSITNLDGRSEKHYEYIREGYLSLKDIFGIDVDKMDSFKEVSYDIMLNGAKSVEFTYYLGNSFVKVTYSPDYFSKSSTSEYCRAFSSVMSQDYNISDYSIAKFPESGYVSRKYDNCEVVYSMAQGIPRMARIMVGDYLITINSVYYSSDEDVVQDYQGFIASEEMTRLAELFSSNDEVFGKSVVNIRDKIFNSSGNRNQSN